ncbi:uncharacterized protein [Elaeis guineensis]|uniref:Uncharacterized protein LOC105050900 n=1 Tax=Elaeis guineensis var. tenera TaxID=51953 RepID=A0A8N4F5B5_ELAGV|nr:uncharacterized protein LOC105050900 [Elaeis guineensis]
MSSINDRFIREAHRRLNVHLYHYMMRIGLFDLARVFRQQTGLSIEDLEGQPHRNVLFNLSLVIEDILPFIQAQGDPRKCYLRLLPLINGIRNMTMQITPRQGLNLYGYPQPHLPQTGFVQSLPRSMQNTSMGPFVTSNQSLVHHPRPSCPLMSNQMFHPLMSNQQLVCHPQPHQAENAVEQDLLSRVGKKNQLDLNDLPPPVDAVDGKPTLQTCIGCSSMGGVGWLKQPIMLREERAKEDSRKRKHPEQSEFGNVFWGDGITWLGSSSGISSTSTSMSNTQRLSVGNAGQNFPMNYCQEPPPQRSSRWITSSYQLPAIQKDTVRGILQSISNVGGSQKNEFSEKAAVMENPEKNKQVQSACQDVTPADSNIYHYSNSLPLIPDPESHSAVLIPGESSKRHEDNDTDDKPSFPEDYKHQCELLKKV